MNKLKDPYMITGTNLYQYVFNRMHESMTDAGKAAMSKMGTIRKVYQDPENVEVIAPGYTFLVHKTAAAFINQAWNPLGPVNAQQEAGVYALWSEQSATSLVCIMTSSLRKPARAMSFILPQRFSFTAHLLLILLRVMKITRVY